MPSRVVFGGLSALTRLGLALVLFAASTLALAQTILRYEIPTPNSGPTAITVGPDGALWFTESQAHKIGRITTDGAITEFALPDGSPAPTGITSGPGGFLWYTAGGSIGRMSTSGEVRTFPLSEFDTFGQIVAGPDGNLWCVAKPLRIARITPDGGMSLFGLEGVPTDSNPAPLSITVGSDGNIWYTTTVGASVGRITTSGVAKAFALAPPRSGATAITTGPDGAIWFSCPFGLFRLTTSADESHYEMQLFSAHPGSSLTKGPDGNLWFSGGGRMTLDGNVTAVDIPDGNAGALALTAGPDGNMWFVDLNGNHIGKVVVGGATTCVADSHTLCLNSGRFSVVAGWQGTPLGPVAQATAVRLTDESGYFWFLEPGNIEVVVKVLNACVDPWNAYWVFAAGLTNLGVTIDVTDTLTGAHQTYTNLLGTPFQPILDVSALKVCP